ncbi:MAG TPA: helical backbone metal receptor [Polyangiaceae bacterium]
MFAVALFVLTLVGCSKHAVGTGTPRRIVSLGPSTTEALFAVGAGSSVVARSRYCEWPPEAMKLPALGGIEPDVETILQLQPDLVVGPSGGWSQHLSATLATHGIATWFPADSASLADVDALIAALGERTGHGPEAKNVVERIHATEHAVEQAVAAEPKPRVLFVVDVAPVYAAGPRTFAGEMLREAGASNALPADTAWTAVGFERVVEIDPDVVIDASSGDAATPSTVTAQSPGWSGVRAVREGHVVRLQDHRVLTPGPRIGEGLAVLARAIHPGARIP